MLVAPYDRLTTGYQLISIIFTVNIRSRNGHTNVYLDADRIERRQHNSHRLRVRDTSSQRPLDRSKSGHRRWCCHRGHSDRGSGRGIHLPAKKKGEEWTGKDGH